MISAADILGRLQGVRGGDGKWSARCPAHEDQNPSLSIAESGGRVLLYCHAGCTYEAIRSALGLDKDDGASSIQTVYDYRDESGALLYQVVRLIPKRFLQRRVLPGGEYEWTMKNVKRKVLYKLRDIVKRPDETVWIVEGEKDADALHRHGLLGTTNCGGAGKWLPAYSQSLAGRRVRIIPDNDEPGKAHAAQVARSVRSIAESVKVVTLDVGPGGDVSDWLGSGRSVAELVALSNGTEEWTVQRIEGGTGPSLTGRHGSFRFDAPKFKLSVQIRASRIHSDGRLTAHLRFTDAARSQTIPASGVVNLSSSRTRATLANDLERSCAAIDAEQWKEILNSLYTQLQDRLIEGDPAMEIRPEEAGENVATWLLEPLVPFNMPSIIYGLGGVGKGWLALLLARATITGEVPRGLPIDVQQTGPVLYLDWETCSHDFHQRWRRVIAPRQDRIIYRRCAGTLEDESDYLQGVILEQKPVLLIVDSAGIACGGDLNSAETAISFFRAIRHLDVTALIIAHTPKNKPGTVFGSAYFMNLARSAWEVRSSSEPEDTDLVLGVAHRKCNVGPKQQPFGISIQIRDDCVISSAADLAASTVGDMASASTRILELLRHDGQKLPREIAETLGLSPDIVRARLRDLKGKGRVAVLHDKSYAIPVDAGEARRSARLGASRPVDVPFGEERECPF